MMSDYVPSLYSFAKGTVASAVGFSTLSLGLLYYGQNYLIYPSAFPPGSRTDVPVPTQFGLPYEDVKLDTEDRVKVHAFLLVQRVDLPPHEATTVKADVGASDEEFAATRPTVIMFHGNGGNAGHRIPLAKVLYMRSRCNVLMLSYRGYGHSEGSPSEKGIRMDSQAALNYVTSHPVLGKTPIILYGQSIGGAVTFDLASRNPTKIRALILENTFLSLPRLIPTALPWLAPVSFLCHQKWDSASKIPLLPPTMPVLMLSGKRDEIVPKEHMRELESLLRPTTTAKDGDEAGKDGEGNDGGGEGGTKEKRPGEFVEFSRGRHNDTCIQPGYWNAVVNFIESATTS